MQRTRTVTWNDPAPEIERFNGMTGIDALRAIASGEIQGAPIALLMGFDLTEVAEGRVVFRGEPGEHVLNPMGQVHGGYAMTMLDSAMGCAALSVLPAGVGYTTLEAKTNLVRTILPSTGPVLAEGKVINAGSRVVTAEGRLVAEQTGKLLAHATTTCLVLRQG